MSRSRSAFSVKDIPGDIGETCELEITPKGKEQRREKVVDHGVERKKMKSTIERNDNSKAIHHKDSGFRGKVCSRKLEERKPANGKHQLQSVASHTQQNGSYVYHGGLGRRNGSHKQQDGFKSRSNMPNSSWGRNTRSPKTFKKGNPQSLPTTSSGRLSNGSPASSMGLGGASFGSFVKQSRADERGVCTRCEISKLGLSSSRCLICRTRFNTSFTPNNNFQTPVRKSSRSVHVLQIGKRERDIIGRTPDTAMEIDSSDDGEEARNDTRSATKPSEQQFQSGLQSSANRMESSKIAYPSRTDPEAVEILDSDIQRLNPLEFLNDTIIDFYIKYIQTDILSLEEGRRFHFFNSFFYKKLTGVIGKKKKVVDYSKLRKWTRGINIFEKDYLFIPVHDKLHWSLAIICFPNHGPGSASGCERCILHLDSMTCGHDSGTVFQFLRSYLAAEKAEMKIDDNIETITSDVIPARKVPVPLQENDSDCGLFLLHYIRKFVESAPKTMKMSDLDNRFEDIRLFGRQWFYPIEASSLRTSIQEQLQKLFAQKDESFDMSSDASLETFEFGIPRKLEAELWYVLPMTSSNFAVCNMYTQFESMLTPHYSARGSTVLVRDFTLLPNTGGH